LSRIAFLAFFSYERKLTFNLTAANYIIALAWVRLFNRIAAYARCAVLAVIA